MDTLIHRALHGWRIWRIQQRLYRACPELREIEAQERAARRAHRATSEIRAQRKRVLHAELQREVRHG